MLVNSQYSYDGEHSASSKPYTFKCQFPKDMFFRLCDDLLNNSELNLAIQYRPPVPAILRFIFTCDIMTANIFENN